MSRVTGNQPDGTPTWIELTVPDLDRAMDFYGALFGWTYETETTGAAGEAADPAAEGAEHGRYAVGLVDGQRAAGLMERPGEAGGAWIMYMATDDCDGTAKRVADAGGRVLWGPVEIRDYGRAALVEDTVGAQFGLWQGRARLGCEVVNEPNSLIRNDLIAPDPAPARDFYAAVFGYTLEPNADLPDADFTFLRRPDGHEIGGIMGDPSAGAAGWGTLFEVADTDAAVARAVAAGGTAGEPEDSVYARHARITDPFGAEFTVGARPKA
ncbi:VOC family protein [Streptomyces rimosus]|uniref:VOC family protein n=1 Tax=Streptomyces rimosus TaxID=1927 RepID=UPI0004C5510D|nr:VOC family protein [Streptomyces rimosus]